jgi:hypothetical protein
MSTLYELGITCYLPTFSHPQPVIKVINYLPTYLVMKLIYCITYLDSRKEPSIKATLPYGWFFLPNAVQYILFLIGRYPCNFGGT